MNNCKEELYNKLRKSKNDADRIEKESEAIQMELEKLKELQRQLEELKTK